MARICRSFIALAKRKGPRASSGVRVARHDYVRRFARALTEKLPLISTFTTGSKSSAWGVHPIDELKRAADSGINGSPKKANESSGILESGASIDAALMAAREFGIHHETQID